MSGALRFDRVFQQQRRPQRLVAEDLAHEGGVARAFFRRRALRQRARARAVGHRFDDHLFGRHAHGLAEVQRAWPRAVPPVFQGCTEPRREKAGVVVVVCREAVVANELHLLSKRIREKLNGAIGREAVAALRAEVGTLRG